MITQLSGLWLDYKIQSVEDQQKMALPMSSITETLTYNHRLIVDSRLYNEDSQPRAWLISKTKRISPNGIVIVTMAQDTFDEHNDYIEKDENGNIVGMWASYFNSNIEPTPVIPDEETTPLQPSSITSTITCSGKPQFKVGGSAKTFTITFNDEDGNVISDHDLGSWQFKFGDTLAPSELFEITSLDDGRIKVKFLGDDSYIGKILTVTNTYDDVTSSIQMEIIPL